MSVEENDVKNMLDDMKKSEDEDENVIGETYLH
jgi:hypothetical protein